MSSGKSTDASSNSNRTYSNNTTNGAGTDGTEGFVHHVFNRMKNAQIKANTIGTTSFHVGPTIFSDEVQTTKGFFLTADESEGCAFVNDGQGNFSYHCGPRIGESSRAQNSAN